MSGGSYTVSTLGGIGGVAFTPIINVPEVAILVVCKAQWTPVRGVNDPIDWRFRRSARKAKEKRRLPSTRYFAR